MLNTTLNYLDHFARFTQKENVEAVERLLSAHKNLAKFERAQLGTRPPKQKTSGRPWTAEPTLNFTGSLCCEDADEAKTLIPSLQDKINDDDLQDLLNEISKLHNR